MKKLISFALAVIFVFSGASFAFAEAIDYASLPTEELLSIILAAEAELRSRNAGGAITAEEVLNRLKNAGLDLEISEIFTEETDTNGLLGRPGQYTGKADFLIQSEDKNTIEVFSTAEDCTSRYQYLEQFADASFGIFGLNQYMYKSDFAILRISYNVIPTIAAQYETAFYALLGRAEGEK